MIGAVGFRQYGNYSLYNRESNKNDFNMNIQDRNMPIAAPEDSGEIPVSGNLPADKSNKSENDTSGLKKDNTQECQTCKNRKYQDGSDDPGVSFKTPTKISADRAASAVRSHENEHVVRERAEANREGRKVVSQSVVYHSAICPECGEAYISGGTTRTVTKADNKTEEVNPVKERFQVGVEKEQKGSFLDTVA